MIIQIIQRTNKYYKQLKLQKKNCKKQNKTKEKKSKTEDKSFYHVKGEFLQVEEFCQRENMRDFFKIKEKKLNEEKKNWLQ